MLPWTQTIKYPGIFVVLSRVFNCSIDAAKCSFYRSVNAIFGRIDRLASEDVTLQLIMTKCMPVLLYGLEACFLTKRQLASIDFVINRLLLLQTSNMDTVNYCRQMFCFDLPSIVMRVIYMLHLA